MGLNKWLKKNLFQREVPMDFFLYNKSRTKFKAASNT